MKGIRFLHKISRNYSPQFAEIPERILSGKRKNRVICDLGFLGG